MLTRRRAKLQGITIGVEPAPETAPHIDGLSDLSLELVFSFLSTTNLINASQVCRRWRDLCSSKRLWSSRSLSYVYESPSESLHVVRLLRREHGIAHYKNLSVCTGHSNSRVYFKDKGDTLMVVTSSTLMVVLCLRHLLKHHVTTLHLSEKTNMFSELEALLVWETLARQVYLETISFCMCRNGALLRSHFEWPRPPLSLTAVTLYFDDSVIGAQLCRPVRSLLEVYRHKLRRVHIRPEDQQALLEFGPTRLRNLQAVLQPGLVEVVRKAKTLNALFLHAKTWNEAASREVLAELLTMRHLQSGLNVLDVTFTSGGKGGGADGGQALLEQLADFAVLMWVRLKGVCGVLVDPSRGPAALRELVKCMPLVRELALDVEPASFPLQALLPSALDGSETAFRVPASLQLLVLGDPKSSRTLCDARWLRLLRRVQDEAPRLHVLLEGQCLQIMVQRGPTRAKSKARLGTTMVLPHPIDHYCQDCPSLAAKKKGHNSMYVGDLCKE